jgi:predicted amidohydrolase YtcJ
MITIYEAKKIITMNPARPVVSHVAVRDGHILGAGSLAELEGWGDYQLDTQFADKVLMPGLVEGHAHAMEGVMWRYTYCGYFDRADPEGKIWTGVTDIDGVIARLREAETKLDDPHVPLPGWQLDPIYFDNRKVTRQDLDKVSATRPVGVVHASHHIMNVNSKALELAGLLRKGVNHPGIPLGDDGLPTGEIKGPDAMTPVGAHVGFDRDILACDEKGLLDFGKLCVRAGVTTVTDLAARLREDAVEMMSEVTARTSYPARVVPLRFWMGLTPEELI